jgi:hypothetical protein
MPFNFYKSTRFEYDIKLNTLRFFENDTGQNPTFYFLIEGLSEVDFALFYQEFASIE